MAQENQLTQERTHHVSVAPAVFTARWSILARSCWIALVVLALGIFGASFPVYLQMLQTVCTGTMCAFGQPTPATVRELHVLGTSVEGYVTLNVVLTCISTAVWLLMGGLLFWRKSHEKLALLASLSLMLQGANGTENMIAASHSIWHILASTSNSLALVVSILVFSLFPSGKFVPGFTRWLVGLFGVWQGVAVIFALLSINASWAGGLIWFSTLSCLVGAQIYRYRRVSTLEQRQQTKWVVFSLALVFLAEIGLSLPYFFPALFPALSSYGSLYTLVNNTITPLILLLFPLCIGIAILRYRLWNIDPIINRTLVYAALTASVIATYALVVGYFSIAFQVHGNPLVSLLATGLIAVIFHPLHTRLQRAVNRLLYGERDEPYTVISRLGSRLEMTLAPDMILPTIVETVAHALKLPYAAITFKQDEAFLVMASYGAEKGATVHLPLVSQAEQVGELILAPRAPGETFTPADQRLLGDLARQAGIAAHAVRLTTDLKRLTIDLQRSREHLITTREEERRRLRRDLHDGLGPTLGHLTLQLDGVSDLIVQDPSAAQAQVAQLKAVVQGTMADIRQLVYALRPPALDELGLVTALCEQATQYQQVGGLQIKVEAQTALPPLPAAVEVAAYRIAQEALTNVVRHAQAHTCRLLLTVTDALLLDILDDGRGFPATLWAGVGLASMRERAAELGGTCVIEARPEGGTHVHARLPLPKE